MENTNSTLEAALVTRLTGEGFDAALYCMGREMGDAVRVNTTDGYALVTFGLTHAGSIELGLYDNEDEPVAYDMATDTDTDDVVAALADVATR